MYRNPFGPKICAASVLGPCLLCVLKRLLGRSNFRILMPELLPGRLYSNHLKPVHPTVLNTCPAVVAKSRARLGNNSFNKASSAGVIIGEAHFEAIFASSYDEDYSPNAGSCCMMPAATQILKMNMGAKQGDPNIDPKRLYNLL